MYRARRSRRGQHAWLASLRCSFMKCDGRSADRWHEGGVCRPLHAQVPRYARDDSKDFRQGCYELFERLLWNDVRRQKANDLLARRTDDEAARQQCSGNRCRGTIELDPPHQSLASNGDDAVAGKLLQLGLEPLAGLIDLAEELLRFAHDLVAEPARKRVSAERRAVMPRLHETFERGTGEHGAKGQSAAEGLRERDDVGNDAALLKREEGSEAAEATLDLVEDEDRAAFVGEAPRRDEELIGERNDPSLAHDRLEEDRGSFGGHRRLESRDVVRFDKRHVRYERGERRAIRLVPCQRESAGSPAVKALLQRDEVRAARIRETRELDGRLVRLGSAVAEERAAESRRPHELFGEDALRRVVVEIRDVQER